MSEVYSPVQVGSPPAQSSDAKSCVSRERNAFIISILLCIKVGDGIDRETQDFASHGGEVHLSSAYYCA